MSKSDVARLMQLIAEEETSAQLGLYGPSAQARHDAIIARMEQGTALALQLFKQGRNQEGIAAWQEADLGEAQP